ncbi:hypothetical protein [Mesorhizobium sp. f-mel]
MSPAGTPSPAGFLFPASIEQDAPMLAYIDRLMGLGKVDKAED